MILNFPKKLFIIFAILAIQGFFLYAFYINEGLIFNFKISYLTKVYLPSYTLSLNNFRLTANNHLASAFPAFNFNDTYSDNISSVSDQYAKSIPVLLYHGIIEKPDGENMLIDNFRDQMFALKKAGWQTVSIEDFYKFMKGEKNLPEKSFLLTFDDGRKDSYYPVDPILKALDYNAAMFVISGRSLGEESKTNPFHLSEKELKRMTKGGRWEIQSHGKDDHDFYKISADGSEGHFLSNKLWREDEQRIETEEEFKERIYRDLASSKNELESAFGIKVSGFAYPFGDFGQSSINFHGAESIVPDIVKSVYPLSFYQVWPGKGSSFNYPNENGSFIKRIDVKPNWSSDNLMAVLDAAIEKSLPYMDNFADYNGWIKTWGNVDFKDNSMIISAPASTTGSMVFFEGTDLWLNYVLKADVYLGKGQTYSVIAGYKDNSNYVFCSFTPSGVRLEQMVRGERKILDEFKGKFDLLEKEKNIGISFAGTDAACYLNNKRVIDTSDIDEKLNKGGIGFKTWDPQLNNSEITIKNVIVEKIK